MTLPQQFTLFSKYFSLHIKYQFKDELVPEKKKIQHQNDVQNTSPKW